MLSHIIEGFALTGIDSFIVVTGYLGHQVEDFSRRFSADHPELKIETVRQHELNGTAGAMLCARSFADQDDFVLGWGDILMDRENYPRFVKSARETSYDLLLAVNRTSDPYRGAAVYVDGQMRVERLVEKPPRGTSTTNWNNAGLFAAGVSIFGYLEELTPSERGELELPAAIGQMIANQMDVRAIDIRGFWSDVGTPEDLELARQRFKPGRNVDDAS
jgi:dTDP-glucose pyrophosphorylase